MRCTSTSWAVGELKQEAHGTLGLPTKVPAQLPVRREVLGSCGCGPGGGKEAAETRVESRRDLWEDCPTPEPRSEYGRGVEAVPLSEEEQRILSEIEQQLYETDPALARDIADTTIYSHAARNLKWAVLGFLVGTAMLVLTLATHFLLAFGGFLVMLVSALAIERNARRMGKAGLEQLARSMRAAGLRDAFGSANQRMRDRFRRDD